MKPGKERARKWALAIGTTLVLFACLELVVRLYTFSTGRGFLDSPDTFRSPFITMMWEPEPLVRADRLRFKGKWVARRKPPGERRVLFLGGSTTENANVDVTFTELLEERLTSRFQPLAVRCLNAGTSGYSTAHSLVNFGLRAIEADPDVVVVMHNVNDASVAEFGSEVAPDFGNKYKESFYLAYRHRTGLFNELLKVSRLARNVAYRLDAIHYPALRSMQPSTSAQAQEALRLFERNLRSLHGIAAAHQVVLVLMTEPGRRQSHSSSAFIAFNDRIRAVSNELSTPLVDLARSITVDDDFYDEIHYSQKGTRAVAAAIYPVLEHQLVTLQAKGARGTAH